MAFRIVCVHEPAKMSIKNTQKEFSSGVEKQTISTTAFQTCISYTIDGIRINPTVTMVKHNLKRARCLPSPSLLGKRWDGCLPLVLPNLEPAEGHSAHNWRTPATQRVTGMNVRYSQGNPRANRGGVGAIVNPRNKHTLPSVYLIHGIPAR